MDAEQAVRIPEALGVDLAQVLHGEQRFTYRAPVMVGDTLRFEPRIASITDKKGGAMTLAVVETKVTNQHGVHVADCSAHGRGAATRWPHERRLRTIPRSASASSTRRSRRSAVTRWRSIAARRATTIRSMSTSISRRSRRISRRVRARHAGDGLLGQALTDAVPPPRLRTLFDAASSRSPSSARADLRGPCHRAGRTEWRALREARADDQGPERRRQTRRRSRHRL